MEDFGVEEPKSTRIRRASNSKLPQASEIEDRDIRERVKELLKRSTVTAMKISESRELLEQLESEMGAICEAYDLKGFRHGLHCYEYYGWHTRKTLSKVKLLELGVSAEIIEAAYTESKPYIMQKVNPFDVE
jgi:hypothetical protein